jgi:hypothetical protein
MAQIGTIRLQGPTDAYDVPVFEPADDDERTALRVQTSSGPGCIALADPAVAAFPALRIETANGVRAVTDEPTFVPRDTVIESFELDLSEWRGDKYNSYRRSERSWNGQWSLFISNQNARYTVWTLPEYGGEWFLPKGYQWVYRFNSPSDGSFPFIDHLFGKRTGGEDGSYKVRVHKGESDLEVLKVSESPDPTGPDETLSETFIDAGISNDTWYQVRVDWYANDSITATLFDSQANQLAQTTGTDDGTPLRGMGYGWFTYQMDAYVDAVYVNGPI